MEKPKDGDIRFVLAKSTYVEGKKWSEESTTYKTYYTGKDKDGIKDNYSKDIYDAVIFDNNKHRISLRAPNPFKRIDIRKHYITEDFVKERNKRLRGPRMLIDIKRFLIAVRIMEGWK